MLLAFLKKTFLVNFYHKDKLIIFSHAKKTYLVIYIGNARHQRGAGRQRDRVVRAPDLKSVGRYRSDR